MTRTFVLERKAFQGGTDDIYISPDGRPGNNGSRGSPLDIQTAINYVQPGQRIIMLDGTYIMDRYVTIPRYNEGRNGAMKELVAENRHLAIIDFRKNLRMRGPGGQYSGHGVLVEGSYWKLSGFQVRSAADNSCGVKIGGHNNIIDWLLVYNSGDSGIQISGTNTEPRRFWPSYNIVQFCTSFNNLDESRTNADGFGSKLCVGDGNQFLWNICHNNLDDGWDLFAKKETGAIGVVRFFGNVSYNARRLISGGTGLGGNGFKLGGEGLSTKHDVRHSIAFWNGSSAFTGNSNPDPQQYYCTAIGSSGMALASIGNGPRYNSIASNAVSNNPFTTNLTPDDILYTWAEAFPNLPVPPPLYKEEYGGGLDWLIPEHDWLNQKIFMKRLADGRPAFFTDLDAEGNKTSQSQPVLKPNGPAWESGRTYELVNGSMTATQLQNIPRGAWAFFTDTIPDPDFIPR
jgi:hypothetical protein